MRELKKQDRTSSRLPTDTERKYKLGQIELTAEELEKLKSELVVDEYLSATSSNAIANKTVTNALNNKVTKEANKGLSSNDFTDGYKNKIHTHSNKAILDTITQEKIDLWNAGASGSSALDTYSTDEQVVGTWVTGNTLYRKVLTGNTPSTAQKWEDIGTLPEGVVCTKIYGVLQGYLPVPIYVTNDYYVAIQYNSGENTIQANTNGYLGLSLSVIVEYIKTTN